MKYKLYELMHQKPWNRVASVLGYLVAGTHTTRFKTRINLAITIDTEPGYVGFDERRVWEYMDPKASVGYVKGVDVIENILEKHDAIATFFVSNQCTKSFQIDTLRHEVGFHLHNGKHADEMSYEEQVKALEEGAQFIKTKFHTRPFSFRWGAWGSNEETFIALEEAGYEIDSSICPGCKGERSGYDWSKHNKMLPYKVNNIVEVPCTTVHLFNKFHRMDPVLGPLMTGAFNYLEDLPVIVIATHTSEMVYADGSPTLLADYFDSFLKHITEKYEINFLRMEHVKGYLNISR